MQGKNQIVAARLSPLEHGRIPHPTHCLICAQVKWRCEAAGANTLDVRSADGLDGVATDCRMDFSIEADGDASVVDLAMSYEPASPLALLAAPVLVVDNWLALNVLLPRAFSGSPLVRQRDVPGLAFFALLSTSHSVYK